MTKNRESPNKSEHMPDSNEKFGHEDTQSGTKDSIDKIRFELPEEKAENKVMVRQLAPYGARLLAMACFMRGGRA